MTAALADAARRIAPLAWPVFVGQLAVLAFATTDTVLVARASAADLAALAIGASTYISVFVGLMGAVLAIGPIAGQLYGAGDRAGAGRQAAQAVWMALGLAAVGCAVLAFPDPFLALARVDGEVEDKARRYLGWLAFALPPALVFTVFRGFTIAVSRPKAVMAVQLVGLACKVPLSAMLVFGIDAGPLRLPAFGAPGCALATAVVMWLQLGVAALLLRGDPFYRAFAFAAGRARPHAQSLAALLRLGVPMGASMMIEVTGFTFLSFFIARFGAAAVAGHQIAANLVSLMFMMPLAVAHAAGALVAQRIGAGDRADAERLGWSALVLGLAVAAALGTTVFALRGAIVRLYASDSLIVGAALPLLAWVALFHVADAAQTVAAAVLRAYRIATVPMLVYVVALWGVGLGGGYAVAFDRSGASPAWMHGARGFWAMATVALAVAAVALSAWLARTLRRERRLRIAAAPAIDLQAEAGLRSG